jgi:hypothetical protein
MPILDPARPIVLGLEVAEDLNRDCVLSLNRVDFLIQPIARGIAFSSVAHSGVTAAGLALDEKMVQTVAS